MSTPFLTTVQPNDDLSRQFNGIYNVSPIFLIYSFRKKVVQQKLKSEFSVPRFTTQQWGNFVARICQHHSNQKSNLHYTRVTAKGLTLTNGGAHLRCLPPGQQSSEKVSQRWRVVGDTASELIRTPDFPH